MVLRFTQSMKTTTLEDRRVAMKRATDSLNAVALYKDNGFYKGLLSDMQRVEDKTGTLYRAAKGEEKFDAIDTSA